MDACEEYNDNCPGCQPAMLDVDTGKPLAADHPLALAVKKMWAKLPLETKRACHRVWTKNSRTVADIKAVGEFSAALERELAH